MSEFRGDYLRKPLPGDPLVIPARLMGELIDAVRYVRAQRAQGVGPLEFGASSQTVVKVRNNSGADQDVFGVLGIDVPLILPDDNLSSFQFQPVLAGVIPAAAHVDRFAVLLEPLASGQIGRAVISGLAIVRVAVTTATAALKQVRAQDGDSSALALASQGAQLLWREGGGDGVTEWAVIRFGGTQGGVASTLGVPPGETAPVDGDLVTGPGGTITIGPGGELITGPGGGLITIDDGGELVTAPGGKITIGPGGELVVDGTPENPGVITLPPFPPLVPAPGNVWIVGGGLWFVDGDGGEHELRPEDIPDANPDPFQVWWSAPGADPDVDPGVPEWKSDPVIIALGLRGSNGQEIYQGADSPDEGGWSFYWPNSPPADPPTGAAGPFLAWDTVAPELGGYYGLVWTSVPVYAGSTPGLVPDGTPSNETDFLRRDGTWAAPPGTGGSGATGTLKWRKYVFLYTDFNGDSATEQAFPFEAMGITELIHDAWLFYTTPFTGGSIATSQMSVGWEPDNNDYLISSFDVAQAVTGARRLAGTLRSDFLTSPVTHTIWPPGSAFTNLQIKLQATGSGANLNQLTQGAAQLYLLVSDFEDAELIDWGAP